ncbi:MAG: HXXEE domain-containing protein [Candidatus Sungiibacteriota bacterium]
MISRKLKNIFLLAVILWIAHGIEELVTNLYSVDSHVDTMFSFVKGFTPIYAAFVVFIIMFSITLIVSYMLILGPKWQLRLIIIPGLIMIYELEHFYKAFLMGGYYPGLITALGFPIIAFFFWRELLKSFKTPA